MKGSIPVLVLLLSLDGALYWGIGRLSSEKTDLADRRDELAARVDALRKTDARSRQIEALLRAASQSMGKVEKGLDIAELRDLLIGAERGLDVDRLSLDFRPAQDALKGKESGRVSANLEGSFDAVHTYLERVEGLRLPLAPEAFSLRADDSGRVLLAIEWNGLWSLSNLPREKLELSPAEVARLEGWLEIERGSRPAVNLFSGGEVPVERGPASLTREAPPPPEPSTPELSGGNEHSPLPPRLTGFVIARPELETDVNRRVLAALRFADELRLVGVGDVVGSYRVEEIDARESVLLVHQESGERLKLFLE